MTFFKRKTDEFKAEDVSGELHSVFEYTAFSDETIPGSLDPEWVEREVSYRLGQTGEPMHLQPDGQWLAIRTLRLFRRFS